MEAIKQNNSNFYKRNRLISIQNIDYQLTDDKEIILKPEWDKPLQQGFAENLGFINPKYIRPKVDDVLTDRTIKNKYNSTTNKLDPEAELYIKKQIKTYMVNLWSFKEDQYGLTYMVNL